VYDIEQMAPMRGSFDSSITPDFSSFRANSTGPMKFSRTVLSKTSSEKSWNSIC